jgi:hypothetical protein
MVVMHSPHWPGPDLRPSTRQGRPPPAWQSGDRRSCPEISRSERSRNSMLRRSPYRHPDHLSPVRSQPTSRARAAAPRSSRSPRTRGSQRLRRTAASVRMTDHRAPRPVGMADRVTHDRQARTGSNTTVALTWDLSHIRIEPHDVGADPWKLTIAPDLPDGLVSSENVIEGLPRDHDDEHTVDLTRLLTEEPVRVPRALANPSIPLRTFEVRGCGWRVDAPRRDHQRSTRMKASVAPIEPAVLHLVVRRARDRDGPRPCLKSHRPR